MVFMGWLWIPASPVPKLCQSNQSRNKPVSIVFSHCFPVDHALGPQHTPNFYQPLGYEVAGVATGLDNGLKQDDTAKTHRVLGLELTLLLLCKAESATLRSRLEALKQCCQWMPQEVHDAGQGWQRLVWSFVIRRVVRFGP